MWLWIKRLMLTALMVLAVSQMFRPARSNPAIDPQQEIHSNLSVDVHVAATLSRACNDCHSNRTVWPWYSLVAPVSWLVVSDVNRGRSALNFSEWSTYGAKQQREHLEEICKEVTEGDMPGFSYRLMHRDAALSKADVSAVCSWAQGSAGNSIAEER
jgi:Haem-binding domain